MKKILAILTLALAASTASAHGWYGGYHGGYRNYWVAPFVVGAGVGYISAQPYYAPPAYYYPPQPQAVYVQSAIPAGYTQQQILDSNCNCYRTVLIPNQ